jgi:twitching motility two-component system response regulator PilG
MLPKVQIDGMPIGLAFEAAFLTRCVPLGLDMSLATAGRDYRVLPEGHPALVAFDEFIGCDDGFDALAKIADHKPRIIFVDVMMPRLDGYQTCALIKNNSEFKSTPVIMLSSKDGLFDKAKGRIVGSDQYLTKPFSRNELLDAIQQHVKPAA